MDLIKLNAKNSEELTQKLWGNYEYNDEEHKYWKDGEELISVTTFISKYFPKFIQEEQAEAYSQRLLSKGILKSKEQILKEWDDKREYGTKYHYDIELQLSNPVCIPPLDTIADSKVREALQIVIGYTSLFDVVLIYPEVKIIDKELGLAGTIDLLMITRKGEIILADWKTCNSIYKGEKNNPITPELHDNNYTKYEIQLSVYSYLIERLGLEVIGTYIFHLKMEGGVVIYPTKYFKEITEVMIYGKA